MDKISSIEEFNPVSGKSICKLDKIGIYPAKHYIVSEERIDEAIKSIQWELQDRLEFLRKENCVL